MDTISIGEQKVDRAAWLQERRGFIGASESPILLGLKPSRLRLFLQKTGALAEDGVSTKATRRGLRMEPYIADGFGALTGDPIVATQVVHRHPKSPFIGATIDGVTASGAIVEFKTSGLYGPVRKVDGPDDFEALPPEWLAQGAHQMLATGKQSMMWAVVTPDLELHVIGPWRRPESLIEIIARECRAFWEGHILPGIPPDELDASDAEPLARAFREETGEVLELGDDEERAARAYHDLGIEIRALEKDRDAAKARLLLALGDAAGGTLPSGWQVGRKVITSEYPAREAETRTSVRLFVKEPKQARSS